jgi:glycosyltransferase involved in cell wall biosynthesis
VTGPGLRVAWFGHGEGRRADGLSTYSREVVGALRRRGIETRFFSHDVDGDGVPEPSVRLRAVRVKTLTFSLPGSRQRIGAALAELAPDVVHCSWSFSTLDGEIARMSRAAGAPSVATFHLPYADPRSGRGRVLRGLYRWHVRNLSAYDHCVALSDVQAELLAAAGYPSDRVTVVHNGVDAEAIFPGASGLRERLGARFVVAYMGRLDPEKRVPALVSSFLQLGWPDDHLLVIAGGGVQEGRVRRLAAGRPNVRMLGVVTDPGLRLELLRAADVYVLPSTAEGLSLGMLEAMAAGCAVVATEAGEDGAALGDAGIRLPVVPLEPHLGAALRRLRDDAALRAELGARARARAVEHYSLGSGIDRLVDLYGRLRAGRAAA